jgi:hypothetical protein
MTVQEALAAAEHLLPGRLLPGRLLPGRPAPDGAEDPRWQAIIEVAMFAEHEPEAIWPFVLKWGSHEEEDVRAGRDLPARGLVAVSLRYHIPKRRVGRKVKRFVRENSRAVLEIRPSERARPCTAFRPFAL